MAYVTEARVFVAELAGRRPPSLSSTPSSPPPSTPSTRSTRCAAPTSSTASPAGWPGSTPPTRPGSPPPADPFCCSPMSWATEERNQNEGVLGWSAGQGGPVEHDLLTDGRRRPEHGLDDQRLAELLDDRRRPQDARSRRQAGQTHTPRQRRDLRPASGQEAVRERQRDARTSAPGGSGKATSSPSSSAETDGAQPAALVDGGPVRAVEDHLDRASWPSSNSSTVAWSTSPAMSDGAGHDLWPPRRPRGGRCWAWTVNRSMRPPSQRTSWTPDVDLLEALEVEAGAPRAPRPPAVPSGCRRSSRRRR